MRVMVTAALLPLMGCGGGGGGDSGGSGIDPRLSRIDIYESQRLRVLGDPGAGVMGMPMTEAGNIPATGTADFTGSVTIRAETSPATSVLAGDATITMDFDGAEPVTGTFGNFFGTGPDGVLRDYSGSATISDGSIGPGNEWSLDYSGALTATGQSFILDGTVTGDFLGNPVTAIAGSALEAQVNYNGTITDAVVTVVGEGSLSAP